ncbi:MAG: glycosyltransferase family 39 protein [Candidatus Krumholzibacteriota bacterium]|nr:glycosyltransferase family 39 protein [Candidatus Krumholzibacteriota bacterium]
MKRNRPGVLVIIILCAIVLAGFLLRAYHIDYPPIGYHSMKEVHYLSVAKGYLDHGDLLHKRVLYSGTSRGEGYMESFPQFPFLPLIYYAIWSFFGVHLWIARLVVIVFSLASAVLSWLVARELEADDGTAMLTAFFMAIMPLPVFFGRNIQPDAPALFFLLLATLFFLRWISSFRGRDLVVFSVALCAVALVKGTFLILVLPLFFLFPWAVLGDRVERRKIARQTVWPAAGAIVVAAWLVITRLTLVYSDDLFPLERIFLPQAFSLSFWNAVLPVIWEHVGDNYTYIYFSFACVGLLWSLMNSRTKMARYILGAVAAAPVYFVILSDFATRHSYYHMPFLPAVCLAAAAGVVEAASLTDLMKRKHVKTIVVIILILAAVPSLRNRYYRHFDVLALGSDIAGEYIRDHGSEDGRVFISFASPSDNRFDGYRTQLYGTLWASGKRGNLLPNDYKKIISAEFEHNFEWILLYDSEWLKKDQPVMDYIRTNYDIKQIGYRDDQLIYYLLRRGRKFDPSELDDRPIRNAGSYRFSFGTVDINVREI